MSTVEEKINILVVDDVPDKLLATAAILDELGQNVVTVGSGREALRCLLQQDFAAILLDVNMPGMDGFETAALIRARQRTEQTPIIFITAFADDTHAAQGYSLGAVDYILAPVMPEVLRAKVGVFVELFRKNEQVKRQAEQRVVLVREQAARAAAEETTRRSNFLAEASTVLSRSLDYQATVEGATRLLAPAVADLAVIAVRGAGGPTEWTWHPTSQTNATDRDAQPVLPQPLKRSIDQILEHATSTQATVDVDLTDSPGEGDAPSSEVRHAVVLPLQARGRTIGAMCLGFNDAKACTFADVTLAEDLAGRIAIAIDNARLYREIQDGDRRKDEFLAMLGHELRNPLAAINNAIECLTIAGDDRSVADAARDVLTRQVSQMTRLVDDLLDVSRITRGKVELRKEDVELASAISRAVATTQPAIAARRHQLSVTVPDEPVRLSADPARLEQILANLLNNAAKYTEPGGRIWLTAEVEGDQVVTRVRDTGIGISPHLLPRIFELFTQGDRSLDRSQGGLGIGLTLVRSLVELHGGRIEAASAGIDRGSEFCVRLPRVDSPPLPSISAPKNHRQISQPVSPSRKILLVDDNADLVHTLRALLSRLGHEIHVRFDGRSGIEAATSLRPDVVLVDIGLPEMDGYEVARHLRQQVGLEDVLLVAMTGYGQQEDRRRSFEAGFDHHLVKPVRYQALQELLSGVASVGKSSREIAVRARNA